MPAPPWQGLFFSRWHDNEKRLRRFVEEARFIIRTDILKSAFVGELARFTGGATVVLYLHEETDYRAVDARPSGAASSLDSHDPS